MQSVEGMKVIGHELGQMVDTESTVPEYIIKDADRLVSYMAVMVNRRCFFGVIFVTLLTPLMIIISGSEDL